MFYSRGKFTKEVKTEAKAVLRTVIYEIRMEVENEIKAKHAEQLSAYPRNDELKREVESEIQTEFDTRCERLVEKLVAMSKA